MLKVSKSAYECERDNRIAANNAVLQSLGLDHKPVLFDRRPKQTIPPRKRRYEDDPEFVVSKRETRSSGRSAVKYAENSSDDVGESDDNEDLPLPVKVHTKRVALKTSDDSVVNASEDSSNTEGNCIVVEQAKTGRSKCRRCLEVLSAGTLRVGMESWIVGRNVMTWQHPRCFCDGLAITTETSGRGKCKQTKEKFAVGERRLSASAHSTTNNFKLHAAALLLRPVFCALNSSPAAQRTVFEGIANLTELLPEEQEQLSKALGACCSTPIKVENKDCPSTAADDFSPSPSPDKLTKQPAAGLVSKATGRVCWRFAGALCYGNLLPAQESTTTCYARTHKGNTKILTKGNSSWWMID
jgi:hypothetical protein